MRIIDPLTIKISKIKGITNTDKPTIRTLQEYINQLGNENLRYSNSPNKTLSEFKKTDLPAYYLQGKFNSRNKSGCIELSNLIPLDLDFKHEQNLSEEQINELINSIRSEAISLDFKPIIIHKTASGKGLRLIYYIELDTIGRYEYVVRTIAEYLGELLDVKFDSQCYNLNRAWYGCYDCDPYINLHISDIPKELSRFLENQNIETGNVNIANQSAVIVSNLFEQDMLQYLQQNCYDGNKHDAIRKAAIKASSYVLNGIVKLSTAKLFLIDYLKEIPNINDLEAAKKAVDNGFDYGLKEYDKNKLSDKVKIGQREYFASPDIFESTKELLPPKLTQFIKQYDQAHIRDFQLIAFITIISSLLHKVSFEYNGSIQYCNIFSVLISPPASGKGEIKILKKLLHDIESELDKENRFHNLGANFSTAKLIETLSKNGEVGLVFDTEADTLSKNKENEWGDYSTILRKLFANEEEKHLRKSNESTIKLSKPIVSVLLTGTKNQSPRLFEDIDNGLFSRFLFLYYNPKSTFALKKVGFQYDDSYLNELSKLLSKVYFDGTRSWDAKLSQSQLDRIENIFSGYERQINESETFNPGLCYRYALILAKTAVTMTFIKNIDYIVLSDKREFDVDDIMEACFIIIEKLLHTALTLASNYRLNSKEKPIKKLIDDDFLSNLPKQFTRKEFLQQNKAISQRTKDRHLSNLLDKNMIRRIKHGEYIKVDNQI